jgi:hypothetical protein
LVKPPVLGSLTPPVVPSIGLIPPVAEKAAPTEVLPEPPNLAKVSAYRASAPP